MIVFFIILLLCAAALERYSLQNALRGVTVDIRPSKSVVDVDEPFQVITVIENNKRGFVSSLRITQALPNCIEMEEKQLRLQRDDKETRLTGIVYLMPRQRLTRFANASMPRRGRYFFREATLQGGDFLGLSNSVEYQKIMHEIVVFPPRAPQFDVARLLGGFIGEVSANRFILEDPVLTVGFREYTGRDPLKTISWTQTARTGELMVKKYDFTLDIAVNVVVNTEHDGTLVAPGKRLEETFSLARNVCEYLEKRGVSYGFVTNATAPGVSGAWSGIMHKGLGKTHLHSILEGLGRATYDCAAPFSELVATAARYAEHGLSHIIVTPQRSAADTLLAQRLHDKTGGAVIFLSPETMGGDNA